MKHLFPIFEKHPDWIYFDSAATAHKPKVVIEALSQFYAEEYATVHRAAYSQAMLATEKYNASRETARSFLNAAHSEEILFTRGTTDGLNLVALSWACTHLKPGDEILVSESEHHSNLVPWQMAAQKTGAILRWMPMDALGQIDFSSQLSPATKLIAVAHVSNVTGTIHPIAEICRAAKKVGAIVVVDGAQAAPHLSLDVQTLGCDFYAFSGHKCYGPTGIGILYGKKELLESMPPMMGGGDMIERVDLEQTSYASAPLRFEAGTPIIASAIALKTALEFIDTHRNPERENRLRERVEQELLSIEGLSILGRAPQKGPLTTFSVAGIHPLDLASLLDLQQIAVRSGHLCAQPTLRKFGLEAAVRVSFGLYNSEEEIDRFLVALRKAIKTLRNV